MAKRQVTLRLDENLYKEIRIFLLQNDKTFQAYVEELIKADFDFFKSSDKRKDKN
jgi:hypothetical protein